jgi:phosphoglycolate phosphatase
MKKIILFDLDGTLFDTPRAVVETFSETFRTMGYKANTPEEIRSTIGMPLEKAFSQLMGLPINNALVSEAMKQYQLIFRKIILPRASDLLFPNVFSGLNNLYEQNFCMAVVTNKFYRSADDLLTAAGIRHLFSLVVGADQVEKQKPDPEPGELVLKIFNAHANQAVMIGDTTHDIHMANAIGMKSIAVTFGIHSVQELKSAEPTWFADTFNGVVEHIKTHHAYYASVS